MSPKAPASSLRSKRIRRAEASSARSTESRGRMPANSGRDSVPFDGGAAISGGQHVRANMSGMVLRTKVWLEVSGDFVIGEGGLELLEALSSDGSLTRAAAQVDWSYRHAWGYLRRAERALGVRLTLPCRARAHGGAWSSLPPERT
jgi:hypothetical protein